MNNIFKKEITRTAFVLMTNLTIFTIQRFRGCREQYRQKKVFCPGPEERSFLLEVTKFKGF